MNCYISNTIYSYLVVLILTWVGSDKVHATLVMGSVEGIVGRDLDGEALAVPVAVAALGRLLGVRVLHLKCKSVVHFSRRALENKSFYL